MKVTQHDIARLTDDEAKRLVVGLSESLAPHGQGSPTDDFLWEFAWSVVRAIKARRLTVAVFEQELLNDDGPGALVGPDDDPVGDALRELRGEEP